METVLGNGIKPELLREELAVHGEGISGEGSRSQREDGDTRDQLPQTLKICGEVESMGEDEVRPSYGLTALYN